MQLVENYRKYSDTHGSELDHEIVHSVDIDYTNTLYVGLSYSPDQSKL